MLLSHLDWQSRILYLIGLNILMMLKDNCFSSWVDKKIVILQEMCLNILPDFAELVEYSSLKNAIVPRLKKLCLTTTSLNVRYVIYNIMEYMIIFIISDLMHIICKRYIIPYTYTIEYVYINTGGGSPTLRETHQ